jgi:PIN like domain
LVKSSPPEPEPIVFFLDRCLGKIIVPTRLRSAGLLVEVHSQHFPRHENSAEESDCEWLRLAGQKGWVVLSKNENIRRNQIEIAEILNSGVAAFISTASNITGDELAGSFLTAMPAIRRVLLKYERPFLATVSRSGVVTVLWTKKGPVARKGH